MELPAALLQQIREHAEACYPDECCGVVMADKNSPHSPRRVRPCTNAQDRLHALDPVKYPRTNRNAYFIDPKDLLGIQRECRERNERVCLIYHSHPDVEAYFSEEDQRRAVIDGRPLHPNVRYLVISVIQGKAAGTALFQWNQDAGKLVSCE